MLWRYKHFHHIRHTISKLELPINITLQLHRVALDNLGAEIQQVFTLRIITCLHQRILNDVKHFWGLPISPIALVPVNISDKLIARHLEFIILNVQECAIFLLLEISPAKWWSVPGVVQVATKGILLLGNFFLVDSGHLQLGVLKEGWAPNYAVRRCAVGIEAAPMERVAKVHLVPHRIMLFWRAIGDLGLSIHIK